MESTTKPTTENQSGGKSPLAGSALLIETLKTTLSNINSLGPSGAIVVYRPWRDEVGKALDAAEELRDEWKQLYNLASFDWDTMPELSRRRFREVVLETAERALIGLQKPNGRDYAFITLTP